MKMENVAASPRATASSKRIVAQRRRDSLAVDAVIMEFV